MYVHQIKSALFCVAWKTILLVSECVYVTHYLYYCYTLNQQKRELKINIYSTRRERERESNRIERNVEQSEQVENGALCTGTITALMGTQRHFYLFTLFSIFWSFELYIKENWPPRVASRAGSSNN